MVALPNKSLMYFEDLTLPAVQVIVMTASMSCDQCRQRVSQVISKMTGLQECTVDVNNKQVIIKGDTGNRWKKLEDDHSEDNQIDDERSCLTSFMAACFGDYMEKKPL